ncbi:uroporphyrinogen-III synthase [Brachybacterium sp. AOP43-C2-M15]|uniref:uroporphyrinogen-III synthase n=1 Tax=Brachybacterium sp. AOP43-C2-M15 TaxID=3457661 RepID=UPI004033958D
MSAPARLSAALEGRRLVLALDRRADELAAALARHGAEIQHAPAMSMIPHVDDPELLARTAELIARPPQLLIATTGVGVRGWFEAADAAGIGDGLRTALAGTRVLARGPKARGAVQQAGLTVDWVAADGTSAEMITYLAGHDLGGLRAAVQHHGSGADGLDEALLAAGAEVVALTVYRWGPPRDPEAVHRSVLDTAGGRCDAVLFTAAPGTENWLVAAERAGALPGITDRVLSGELLMAAVGPLTAAPLEARGLAALLPARSRMGALVRAVVQHFDPAPAESVPSDLAPSDPVLSDPAPSDPAPSDRAPRDLVPTGLAQEDTP